MLLAAQARPSVTNEMLINYFATPIGRCRYLESIISNQFCARPQYAYDDNNVCLAGELLANQRVPPSASRQQARPAAWPPSNSNEAKKFN